MELCGLSEDLVEKPCGIFRCVKKVVQSSVDFSQMSFTKEKRWNAILTV